MQNGSMSLENGLAVSYGVQWTLRVGSSNPIAWYLLPKSSNNVRSQKTWT